MVASSVRTSAKIFRTLARPGARAPGIKLWTPRKGSIARRHPATALVDLLRLPFRKLRSLATLKRSVRTGMVSVVQMYIGRSFVYCPQGQPSAGSTGGTHSPATMTQNAASGHHRRSFVKGQVETSHPRFLSLPLLPLSGVLHSCRIRQGMSPAFSTSRGPTGRSILQLV